MTINSIPPENAPTRWVAISSTNRWKLFDQQVGTSSAAISSMTYLVKPGSVNSMAILGANASEVSMSLVIPSTGEIVFSSFIDLTSNTTIGDWLKYFYEPVYTQEAVTVTNLLDIAQMSIPGYGEAVLAVTLKKPNSTVSAGVLVVGQSVNIGHTQTAPTIGIIDYSKKDIDPFGNPYIIVRNYSKRVSAKVMFNSALTDNINQILAQYRSTPLVWVGAENLYSSLIVYGFYRDYDITIDNVIMSSCNLTIEGLT